VLEKLKESAAGDRLFQIIYFILDVCLKEDELDVEKRYEVFV